MEGKLPVVQSSCTWPPNSQLRYKIILQVRELLVTLQGEGNVIWEQELKGGKRAAKFRSKETYLDHTENLAQNVGEDFQ